VMQNPMNIIRPYSISSLIVLLFLSCNERIENPILFSIAGQSVTIEQAQLSFAFNPQLFNVKDPVLAKKRIFSALIAQQLLASEAENVGIEDTSIFKRISAHKREAMIEKLRTDSVESKVIISEAELKTEYLRALKEIEIVIFTLNENENIVHKQIKRLIWPIQDRNLEDVVYALNPGQESGILKSGSAMFKVKVLDIAQTGEFSSVDFNNRKLALLDHLRRRKIRKIYSDLFYQKIKPQLGTVNLKIVEQVAEYLSLKIEKPVQGQSGLFGSHKELPQKLISEIRLGTENNLEKTAVLFPSGEIWSIEELLNSLKYGPYAFNFSSPQLFKKSFDYNINLLLEHQAIYTLALDQGYATNDQVLNDTEMWRNYFQANAFRYAVLAKNELYLKTTVPKSSVNAGKDLIHQSRLNYMDQYLVKLFKKNKLKMNIPAYQALDTTKTDMVLMKSHFAHRQVVPPLEPLSGLPAWQKEIDNFLNKYSVQ